MLRLKSVLVMLLLLGLTVHVWWLLLKPLIPWLVVCLVLVWIFGLIYRRRW